MKSFSVKLDAAKVQPMRKILGMNNSPRMCFRPRTVIEKKYFDALHPAYVRYHDASQDNPGYAIIEVSQLFPLFHLDENDPKNYIFGPTDEYLALVADTNVIIDFRLGEAIEHTLNRYRVNAPADKEKWARICCRILEHYTEGWADGMHLKNIKYLSVWEEPDHDRLYNGGYDDYLQLFVTAYKILHARFPQMKIGGPNVSGYKTEHSEKFLQICKDNGIVPDFIGGTMYERNADNFAAKIHEVKAMLVKYGFNETEIALTEWHMGPKEWLYHDDEDFTKVDNAAFSVNSLIKLMDTPVTAAYYYAWTTGSWRVLEKDPKKALVTLPIYHGLKFFSEISDCDARIAAEGIDDKDVCVLAGKKGDTQMLLLSCYKEDSFRFDIAVPGCAKGRYKMISDSEEEHSEAWHELEKTDKGFTVCTDGMRVVLMEFEK